MKAPSRQRRKFVLGGAAALALGTRKASATGVAFPIPGRAIRLVVPYTAGGGGDALARRIALPLGERLGAQVIVENRPGGGTVIGATAVARAAPDGHTLFLNVPGFIVLLPFQMSRLPYEPWNDFTPITPLIQTGLVLSCHPSVPAHDVKGLVEHAHAHPGKLAYASWGIGGGSHIFMELLKRRAGIEMVHVPYKGISEIHTDLLQNRVQLVLDATRQGQDYVRSGRLRALGVIGDSRVLGLSDVPTFREQGFEGFDAGISGLSLFGPARMPEPIVERLYREITAIVATRDIIEFMASFGFRPFTLPPKAFLAALKANAAHWKPIIEELGIRLD